MTKQTDLMKDLNRWKDKYFEQSESFDEQKKVASEYASLLQRLLTRISLAAEHTSPELDRELDSLRNAIREATPERNDLVKRLKRIDTLILNSDKSKQQNVEQVVQAMSLLIEQLLALKIPREQKQSLRKLSKSIAERAQDFHAYPGILSEYAVLQAESIKQIVGPIKKELGFFSRFLGGSSVEDAQNIGSSASCFDTEPNVSDLELNDSAEPLRETEIAPGFGAIAVHIRGTLNHLLDQLSLPESASREVAKLRGQINHELNWYELGPTLDDLANLVISAVGKGQRDFENFLLVLDDRLGKVQEFLTESQQADKELRDKSQELDRVMREQVSEMSIKVSNAKDIEELKRSINNHLDSISREMDHFTVEEQQLDSEKEAELKLLQERLQAMEYETQYIRKRLKEERSKALTDALTGLPNREAYDERLELELERWKRYRQPATLVVADIDHFKAVNDNYGHLSGDKVLQIMAKEILNRIRKTDFVARYGGEEFVIILPETNVAVARAVIEKTREMICRLPFHFREENIQISMSFGIAAFEGELDSGGLFERADKALYQAKKNGRNRLEVWNEWSKE